MHYLLPILLASQRCTSLYCRSRLEHHCCLIQLLYNVRSCDFTVRW